MFEGGEDLDDQGVRASLQGVFIFYAYGGSFCGDLDIISSHDARNAQAAIKAHIAELGLEVSGDHVGEFSNDIGNILNAGASSEDFFCHLLCKGIGKSGVNHAINFATETDGTSNADQT